MDDNFKYNLTYLNRLTVINTTAQLLAGGVPVNKATITSIDKLRIKLCIKLARLLIAEVDRTEVKCVNTPKVP